MFLKKPSTSMDSPASKMMGGSTARKKNSLLKCVKEAKVPSLRVATRATPTAAPSRSATPASPSHWQRLRERAWPMRRVAASTVTCRRRSRGP